MEEDISIKEEIRVGRIIQLTSDFEILANAIPSNVYFEIDDAEDETGWTFPKCIFDLVNLRSLSGCFSSWHNIYASCLATLCPGGWIEVLDLDDLSGSSFSSYFSPDSPLHKFLSATTACSEKIGRPWNQDHLDVKVLQDLGFVECELKRWEVPIRGWRKDANGNGMGKLCLLGILEGFEALGLRLLTQEAGWSVDEVKDVCERLRAELMGIVKSGKGEGMAVGLKVLTGQRALQGEEIGSGKGKAERS